MKKQVKQALEIMASFCLSAVFIALAITIGMLLMPVVMLIVFALAVREIFLWKRKTDRNNSRVNIPVVKKTTSRQHQNIAGNNWNLHYFIQAVRRRHIKLDV